MYANVLAYRLMCLAQNTIKTNPDRRKVYNSAAHVCFIEKSLPIVTHRCVASKQIRSFCPVVKETFLTIATTGAPLPHVSPAYQPLGQLLVNSLSFI